MKADHRLVEWIDLVGDLLQRPQADFPVVPIAWQLNRTFSVHTVAWDWREHSGRSGAQMWPVIDLAAIAHLSPAIWAADSDDDAYHHDFRPIHARHPLVQWYAITRDPAPWSTGRVPVSLAPRRDWQLVDDYLKPIGGEQQMAIPYLLDGDSHGTFLLSRPTDDYRDEDVELAGHLQRLIRGLYLCTGPVARAAPGAQIWASADRAGLTATELAVLIHLADGHTAYGIALRLQMAPRTASKHLEHIYRKLGVTNRLSAVTAALEAGILTAAHLPLTSGPKHGALGDGEEQRG